MCENEVSWCARGWYSPWPCRERRSERLVCSWMPWSCFLFEDWVDVQLEPLAWHVAKGVRHYVDSKTVIYGIKNFVSYFCINIERFVFMFNLSVINNKYAHRKHNYLTMILKKIIYAKKINFTVKLKTIKKAPFSVNLTVKIFIRF